MKIYYRIKCKDGNTPGEYHATYNNKTNQIAKEHITVYLPRIYNHLKGDDFTRDFDDLFSHVISHEIIHGILLRHVSKKACSQWDNLIGSGVIPTNPFDIRAGMSLLTREERKIIGGYKHVRSRWL